MTEKADPTADPIPEPILEPIDEAAEEAAEPVETLAQINSQTLPAGNWGWRAVVALTVGAGLVASGVWMSENFGGGETQLREQAARIDALASERATLRNALTATEAELDGVADRLAAVDQRLAALTDAMGGVTAAADFDVLAGDVNTRLGVLEAARENPVDQVDTTAALADLADRLGAMAAMAARIAALEAFAQSVGELADARPGEGVVAAPNPALSIRLAELEQDLRTLDAALAVAVETLAAEAVVPDLSQVEARLTEVEETLRSVGPAAASRGSASALVLAAGQLRDRLLGPGPFRAELDTVRQVAQSRVLVDRELQSAMNRLGDLASDGVVTVDQLTREFSGLARQIVTATAPDEGWVADLWGRVRGVISVRRTGDIEGDTTQAIVARAEVRLADRDLAGAVAELDSLDGPSLNAVRSWMVLARARATADEAAALIATRAVALLAQEFGPTP